MIFAIVNIRTKVGYRIDLNFSKSVDQQIVFVFFNFYVDGCLFIEAAKVL